MAQGSVENQGWVVCVERVATGRSSYLLARRFNQRLPVSVGSYRTLDNKSL
jgi:hypothetical protein